MNFTNILRKNIGTIVAGLGFIVLCIITFGDLGEVFSDGYWQNVRENLLGISLVSIGLTFVQTTIKQGIAEQALQKGLNTERTAAKYEEHRSMIKNNADKQRYLPYFLQMYNKKHTKLAKQEYLINNNYASEKTLYASGVKRLIKRYEQIRVHITPASIKWSTVDVVYEKNGRIITLDEHRRRRTIKSFIFSAIVMVGTTFITGGLFFVSSGEPFWQKLVKLFAYCITIAITVIFAVIKEYEKGAFGVPNELDEINQIWHEFEIWEVPQWVIDEVEGLNKGEVIIDEQNETERTVERRTDLQEEQETDESLWCGSPCDLVPISFVDVDLLLSGDKEQCRQCDGDTQPAR
jgi:hypothetical protein